MDLFLAMTYSKKQVIALWNIKVRLVELPTPWIDEGQDMPTNKTVAKHCLLSTERYLHKKPNIILQ